MNADGVGGFFVNQIQHALAHGIRPPEVVGVPGRMGIGTRRRRPCGGLRFVQQFGEDRGRQHGGVGFARAGQQGCGVAGDEAGVDAAGGEVGVRGDAGEQVEVAGHAGHIAIRQGGPQLLQGFGAAGAVADQLGQHRVVMHRDGVAGGETGVDAHAVPLRRGAKTGQAADGGSKVAGGVFGVDPHLEGVAVQADLFLGGRQGLTGGDTQLPFHQIKAGDGLGDRMLHLQSCVHFQKVESGFIGDELHGAGADIADGLGGIDGSAAHRGAAGFVHAGRGGFLDHFLVAPLGGAVALEQMHGVAVPVGEDLDLDVAGARDVAFHQHAGIAERGGTFLLGGGQRAGEVVDVLNHAHAAPTASGDGLDDDGEADFPGGGSEKGRILIGAVIAGQQRNAGTFHQRLGRSLRSHGAHGGGRGADEDNAGCIAGFDEFRVLRQEAVAGMDGFRTGAFRGVDDAGDVEVAIARRGRADGDGAISRRNVHGGGVGLGIDGDGFDAHAPRGARDAAGDLAAIGDEEGAYHPRGGCLRHHHHIRNTPNFVGSIGAFSAAERERPSTRRVSAGSMIPSSHSRAVA